MSSPNIEIELGDCFELSKWKIERGGLEDS